MFDISTAIMIFDMCFNNVFIFNIVLHANVTSTSEQNF